MTEKEYYAQYEAKIKEDLNMTEEEFKEKVKVLIQWQNEVLSERVFGIFRAHVDYFSLDGYQCGNFPSFNFNTYYIEKYVLVEDKYSIDYIWSMGRIEVECNYERIRFDNGKNVTTRGDMLEEDIIYIDADHIHLSEEDYKNVYRKKIIEDGVNVIKECREVVLAQLSALQSIINLVVPAWESCFYNDKRLIYDNILEKIKN